MKNENLQGERKPPLLVIEPKGKMHHCYLDIIEKYYFCHRRNSYTVVFSLSRCVMNFQREFLYSTWKTSYFISLKKKFWDMLSRVVVNYKIKWCHKRNRKVSIFDTLIFSEGFLQFGVTYTKNFYWGYVSSFRNTISFVDQVKSKSK